MKTQSWTPSYLGTVTRRRFLKGTAAGAGAIALIACGGGGGGSVQFEDASNAQEPGKVWFAANDWKLADETRQAVRGGVYRGVATGDQTGHFDAIALMRSQAPVGPHVLELLMGRNRGPGIEPGSVEASTPAGMLAESWEISADGMSVTFNMRPGVKWHNVAPVNGRTMDLDDWKTSQERHLSIGVYRSVLEEFLDRTEFPDARHMVWKMKAPYAPIFDRIYSERFAFPVQPKELNTNVTLAEQTSVGTGYKVLDKYQPAIGFEYKKHVDYWGGEPFIDRWHAPIIPEYANRYAQFVNGNIIDFTPTARDVLLLHRDAPGTVIVAEPISDLNVTRMRFGRMNPSAQPWGDPRVRVAIRRSIDFPTIGAFLANKAEFEAAGIPVELSPMTHLPQNPSYWLNPDKGELGALSANYLYDPAEAKKLTAAAGYNEPIPMDYYVALSQGEISEDNLIVMDSLQATGTFNLNIHRVATAAEHNKYRIDGLYDGLIPQSGYSDDADYFVARDYHSKGRAAVGELPQAYPDARIDSLGDAQRLELDPAKRAEVLKDFQRLLAELMPAVPGRHLSTSFSFRWPWLHNTNHGTTAGSWTGTDSPPLGVPVPGGHLHWLDANMPNRNSGAS
jgi:peptide/nickel transport system substrate-binding protein